MITTSVQRSLAPAEVWMLLAKRSTNIQHLATEPIHVLFASLLWLDGNRWWPYALVFCIFLAPAERWLGSPRWLTVGLSAHIGATYISEGALYLAIRHGSASPTLVGARDIGVSDFVVGVAAVLSYLIVNPWCYGYLTAAISIFAAALALSPTFTSLGHLCALLIGLAFYPLSRIHPMPVRDPARFATNALRAVSGRRGHERMPLRDGPRRRCPHHDD
jgi:hypothetical protein